MMIAKSQTLRQLRRGPGREEPVDAAQSTERGMRPEASNFSAKESPTPASCVRGAGSSSPIKEPEQRGCRSVVDHR